MIYASDGEVRRRGSDGEAYRPARTVPRRRRVDGERLVVRTVLGALLLSAVWLFYVLWTV